MTAPDDTGTVAVALAGLKGAVDTGFARLNGRLDVALQRTDTVEREVSDLKADIKALRAQMWRLSMAAAAIGTGGATGVWQFMQ